MLSSPTTTVPEPKMFLTQGLANLDEHIHDLQALFEQFQLQSVEAANPMLDLLTFASGAHYFAVIHEGSPSPPNHCPTSLSPISIAAETGSEQVPPAWSTTAWNPSWNTTAWNPSWSTPAPVAPTPPLSPTSKIAGFVYLIPSTQDIQNPLHVGELNIGVVLHPDFRGRGLATEAVVKVLEIAFKDHSCHRIQAVITEPYVQGRAVALFTKCGFGHEGIRRRAFFGPYDGAWKDVAYLAMLDTDYMVRTEILRRPTSSAPQSLWDELFARHAREREELMRWEDRQRYIKRSPSSQTLRGRGVCVSPAPSFTASSTSGSSSRFRSLPASTSAASVSSSDRSAKKRRLESTDIDVKSEFDEPSFPLFGGTSNASRDTTPSDTEPIPDPASGANQQVFQSIRDRLVTTYNAVSSGPSISGSISGSFLYPSSRSESDSHSQPPDYSLLEDTSNSPPHSVSEASESFSSSSPWDVLNSNRGSTGTRANSTGTWSDVVDDEVVDMFGYAL